VRRSCGARQLPCNCGYRCYALLLAYYATALACAADMRRRRGLWVAARRLGGGLRYAADMLQLGRGGRRPAWGEIKRPFPFSSRQTLSDLSMVTAMCESRVEAWRLTADMRSLTIAHVPELGEGARLTCLSRSRAERVSARRSP